LGKAAQPAGETQVAAGAALSDEALRAIATRRGLSFLTAGELPATLPLVKNLSPKYLRHYVACPVAIDGGIVTVATADPANTLLLDDLRQNLGASVRLCVAPAGAILEAIARTYEATTALQKIVDENKAKDDRNMMQADAPVKEIVYRLRAR